MADIKFKKSEGQHILKNHGLIDTIIEKARIKHTDIALEIGAGTGVITSKLLQKAKKVIAYEADKKLARELNNKLCKSLEIKNKLELHVADVLKQDLPHFDICVSNIPFNISCPVIMKLMECDFKSAYVLVQKEFGDRMIAKPGSDEYSRLSVMCQLMGHVEKVLKVSRNSFVPAPKVDTCFMKIEPRIPRPCIDVKEFDLLLKICFSRKNRTLGANLKTSIIQNKIKAISDYADINPDLVIDQILETLKFEIARSSKMEIEDFLILLLEFKKAGIHFY